MSFHIRPQDNPDPNTVFDKGAAESRVNELTRVIVGVLVEADGKKWAKECRLAGEPITPYPLVNEGEIMEKFGQEAYEEALKILEQERKNVVAERTPYIKDVLNRVIKRLSFLTWTPHGKGKTYIAKKFVPDRDGYGMEERDIAYFETPEGEERQREIDLVRDQLSEFWDYIPYMDADTHKLWDKAYDLANIERVRVEDATKAQTSAEEPKAETEVKGK
jgi:hypothetical protein